MAIRYTSVIHPLYVWRDLAQFAVLEASVCTHIRWNFKNAGKRGSSVAFSVGQMLMLGVKERCEQKISHIYRSEGFARAAYFIPGRDGMGSGQIQKLFRHRRRRLLLK